MDESFKQSLECLFCLVNEHPKSPKTHTRKVEFFTFWLSISNEQRDSLCSKLPDSFKEGIKKLDVPASQKDVEKLNESVLTQNKDQVEQVHEGIKAAQKHLGQNNQELAKKASKISIDALKSD